MTSVERDRLRRLVTEEFLNGDDLWDIEKAHDLPRAFLLSLLRESLRHYQAHYRPAKRKVRKGDSMNKLVLAVLIAGLWPAPAPAQDITNVLDSLLAARTPSTVLVTVTATSGDGASCKITKLSGSRVNATVSCVSADGKSAFRSGSLVSTSTVASAALAGLGDVLCLVGVNPTAAAVTMGSLGAIPANGIAWQCSTAVTGGPPTAPVAGTAQWP